MTTSFVQTNRPFAVHTPLGDDALLLERFDGEERVSHPFQFRLDMLSTNPALDPDVVLGNPASITVALEDGTERVIHGRISRFAQLGARDGMAVYDADLVPWLWFLTLARECRIFQHKSVPEIVEAVFRAQGFSDFESRLMGTYPRREYCVQYRETHLEFVSRLLEAEGIFYYFRHEPDKHVLVLADAPDAMQPAWGKRSASMQPRDGGRQDDVVLDFSREHAVQSGRVALTSYDYLKPTQALRSTVGDGGAEVHDYPADFLDHGEGDRYARLHLEECMARRQVVRGGGTCRAFQSGALFELEHHYRADLNQPYQLLRVRHVAANGTYMGGHAATATYRNEFEAIPARVPFRPARATPLPTVRGTQSAVVVGKAGEEIWTDEHGRVKVQFHWDREGKRDENSTCWIRVVHPWSGKAWGMVNVPRIGQEVVVDFLEGDPDRPLIIGRVSNAEQTPGSFSHASRLPGDHALAGWKSRELAGGSGYGELLFDDTAGELRTKLSSEHAATQLNLGYLTHPRANAKAEPRGEGYELRTDGWGSVRAAKGLLLTTDGQARAVGGQLDRSELVACLEEALNLARSLGERAGQHRADAGDRAPQQKIMEGAHDWGSGSNAESKGGGAGGAPLVAVSAPAGIALTTPRAITSFSGEHTDLVARKNHQLTSGQTTNINAGTGMSFYADSGGIRSIANRGVHLTQAQQDDVVINADRSIRLTASHEHILAVAQKHITLMAGGAYIKIEGGNIELGCPGTVRIKAANYSLTGPASLAEELPKFDVGKTDLRYVLSYDAERLQPAADMKYRITLKGGEVVEGLTDAAGRTTVLEKDAMHIADIELLRPR